MDTKERREEYGQQDDRTATRTQDTTTYPQRDRELEQPALTKEAASINGGTHRNTRRRPQKDRTNAEDRDRREMIKYYLEKRRELIELEDKGVNLRCISKEEAPKVKEGLDSLFKNELMPRIEMTLPRKLAFEGAYLECLDIIRGHIAMVQEIPVEKMYAHSNTPKTIDKAKAQQRRNKLISRLGRSRTEQYQKGTRGRKKSNTAHQNMSCHEHTPKERISRDRRHHQRSGTSNQRRIRAKAESHDRPERTSQIPVLACASSSSLLSPRIHKVPKWPCSAADCRAKL